VEYLHGDPAKAKAQLGGIPKTPFADLVSEMMEADLELMRTDPRA
jgi:GDPmannose 4,6-dehydratase